MWFHALAKDEHHGSYDTSVCIMDERRCSIRDVLNVNPISSARLGIPIFRYPLKRLCVTFIEDVPVLPAPDLFPVVPKPIFDSFDYAPLGLSTKINPDVLPRLTTLAIRFMNVVPYMSPSFVDSVQSRRPVVSTGTALQTLRLSIPLAMLLRLHPDATGRWTYLCDKGFVSHGME